MLKFLTASVMLLILAHAAATEQQDPRKTCERLLKDFKSEQGRKADAIDPEQECKRNNDSASYWNCTDERIKNGDNYLYAAAQCRNKS